MSQQDTYQEMVQALEQIVDGGVLSIDQVWFKETGEDITPRFYLNSSVLEGAMEMDEDTSDTTMYQWLEAMEAIAQNNGFEPKPLAISAIATIIDDQEKLTTILDDDDRVEKVALRLTMEVSEECFSGMNISLSLVIYRRDEEGVLCEVHLLDVFAYDTAEV